MIENKYYDIILRDGKKCEGLENSKNRKVRDLDGIMIEMLKRGGSNIQREIATLSGKIIRNNSAGMENLYNDTNI